MIVEAMVCGTPVIATNWGSVPEIIEEGVAGYIVDSERAAVAYICARHAGIASAFAANSSAGLRSPWSTTICVSIADRDATADADEEQRGRADLMDQKVDAIQPSEARTASYARSARFSLKDGDSVVVCDAYGDIDVEADGLPSPTTLGCCRGLRLRIAGERPDLLSAVRGRDNVILTSNMANPRLPDAPAVVVHLARAKLIWAGRMHERISCTNYSNAEGSSCHCRCSSPPTSSTCSRCAVRSGPSTVTRTCQKSRTARSFCVTRALIASPGRRQSHFPKRWRD